MSELKPVLLRDMLPAPVLDRQPASYRHWPALASDDPVGEHTKLIPYADCRAIVAEQESALAVVAPAPIAARLTALLVGSYPQAAPAEPVIYIRQITTIFAEFPEDLGEQAVAILIRSLKFPPAPADLYQHLAELRGKRKVAILRAKMHAREHERRAAARADAASGKRYADMSDAERVAFDRFISGTIRGDQRAEPDRREASDGPRPLADVVNLQPAARRTAGDDL